jgi:hypothetical protein
MSVSLITRVLKLSAKLVQTFVDRGSCVVSTTDPYGRILGLVHRTPNNKIGKNKEKYKINYKKIWNEIINYHLKNKKRI